MDSVAIDYCSKYICGKPTPSNESLEVGWFPIDKVVGMKENPLYVKRMQNMVSCYTNIYCFAFAKIPYEFVIDEELIVGL